MKDIFFGELKFPGWEQLLINLVIWVLFVAIVIWLIRLVFNKFRSAELTNKNEKFYMVRDLFLQLTDIESLIAFMFVFAVYAGFWEWIVRIENYDWTLYDTYLAASSQILTFIIIIVIFSIKLIKFRKPYK